MSAAHCTRFPGPSAPDRNYRITIHRHAKNAPYWIKDYCTLFKCKEMRKECCRIRCTCTLQCMMAWLCIMELSGVIFATGVTGSMNIDRRTNMKPIGFARFWQKMLWETQQIFDNKIIKSAKAALIYVGLFSVQYDTANTMQWPSWKWRARWWWW